LTPDLPWLSGESICVLSSDSLNANAAENVLICLVDDRQNFRDAIAVDFSRRITTMVSASAGKEKSQIRSGNARPV